MSRPEGEFPTQARDYRLFGLGLRSEWPLACPEATGRSPVCVEIVAATASRFVDVAPDAPDGWFAHVGLRDGSEYLRWTDLFEFLISPDGKRIEGRSLAKSNAESFQNYLLNQVLSFSLLKLGFEPLHATAVVVDGRALAFAAMPGRGKSTLGAAFLEDGHRLLTDDVLVLDQAAGGFLAQPSMPRIKLFPEIARTLLGGDTGGTPMNEDTPKMIVPLDERRFCEEPVPLRAVYVLAETRGAKRVSIRRMHARRAFVALTKHTFNPVVADETRLRQQFEFATKVASVVPVKSLSFPRRLELLPEVREAILADE